MIDIVGENCTGCSTCVSRCPKQCISFFDRNCGFGYPVIDAQNCIKCNLCAFVCPVLNDISPNLYKQKSFAAQAVDISAGSASGGAFSSIASLVISSGGIVFGAAYVNGDEVRHIPVESVSDLSKLYGSKYVQSIIPVHTFHQIKCELNKGRKVLFSGTPCQIEGLKLFLRNSYDNLILIDLICHGVPSIKVFKEYIAFCEKLRGKKVQDFRFRDNRDGWDNIFKSTIMFEDGTEEYNSPLANLWNRIFFSELVTRPSCTNCKFTSINRCGDLTLGDFWGIGELSKITKNKGVSLILCNTAKGWDVLQKSGLNLVEAHTNELEHPNLYHPTKRNIQTKEFEEYYIKHGFDKAIKKYFNYSQWLDFKIRVYMKLKKFTKR